MLRALLALPALKDSEWKRALLVCMGVSLVLHLLAAAFSVGYYHTDEHFQILEFLSYKLGHATSTDLAGEFREKIRPWFQPGMDYALARCMMALGIDNPFHWAWVFRLISSLLGWLSLVGLSLLSYSWFESPGLRKAALLLAGTLWFLPALHARHSSESLSGSVFYIAASLLFLFRSNPNWPKWPRFSARFAIGLLFGAAFEFRYQVGFLVIAALSYEFFTRRSRPLSDRIARMIPLKLGIVAMIALGICIDRWGYGSWTLAPWNYIRYNLIQGHVADVDTQPIWDFFRATLTESFPVLGFPTLAVCVLGWIFRPLHLLTVITLPLYLVHSLIGHKELRFIFPIAHAAPFLLLLALTAKHRAGLLWRKLCFSRAGRISCQALFALNLLVLVPTTLLPCWAPARMLEQLYHLRSSLPSGERMQVLYKDKNPFEVLGIPLTFYRPPGTESVRIASYEELRALTLSANDLPVWFFEQTPVSLASPGEAALGPASEFCRPVIHSLPGGISALLRWAPLSRITQRVTDWILYRCSSADLTNTEGSGHP